MNEPADSAGARERAVDLGIEALADDDLVALLLGTGRNGEPVGVLAARVLAESGGLIGLMRRGKGELARASGIGEVKATRLFAGLEIGRRALAAEMRPSGGRFGDAAAVEAWARPRLAALEHEELWVLALDGRQGLRAARRAASGGIHGMHVSPRDVLRIVVREAASAFVVVHNHPSGDPTPSAQDIDFIRRLARAAETIGVPLLDHVVVARAGYGSLFDAGALAPDDSRGRG